VLAVVMVGAGFSGSMGEPVPKLRPALPDHPEAEQNDKADAGVDKELHCPVLGKPLGADDGEDSEEQDDRGMGNGNGGCHQPRGARRA